MVCSLAMPQPCPPSYQRRCIPAMPCKNIGRKITFMQISDGQKCAHRRAHASEPHVVGPDDEGQKSNHEHGKDERFVTPKRFARIVSQYFSDDPECRQDEHVHFRVTEEPEEMLPQKRAATPANV